MDSKKYDLLIIGAGPAGYTASIYASRYKISNAVLGDVFGGLTMTAHEICNFPSEESIKGFDLMAKMQANVKNLGGEMIFGRVEKIEKIESGFKIHFGNTSTSSVTEIETKRIILATGSKRRKLGLDNESKFLGKGLSYCSTCDGMFARDKIAMVVGGGNSAVTAVNFLADVANKVYLVYRGDKLKAEPMWIDELNKKNNVEIIYQANVKELIGSEKLEKVILDNSKEFELDHLFVEIGSDPANELATELGVELNEKGYIKVDKAQKTNIENVWAAGDITDGSNEFRQIITACAEGAIAGESVFKSFVVS